MRAVTADETRRWTELAEEHGFSDEDGSIALGRFVMTDRRSDRFEIKIVTPLLARRYTEDLREKSPPIMFDRTPDGEIIIPGRWWQELFERLSEDAVIPDENAALAFRAAHGAVTAGDTLLPAETDTIAFELPDEDGERVTYEALPPGGRIHIVFATRNERR
jgi:hypothetical protein